MFRVARMLHGDQLPTSFLRSSAATLGLIESYPAVRRYRSQRPISGTDAGFMPCPYLDANIALNTSLTMVISARPLPPLRGRVAISDVDIWIVCRVRFDE
jgi:hypothetical protein